MTDPNIWVCCGLVLLGSAVHLVKKLSELEAAGNIVAPLTYLGEHPYTSASTVATSLLAIVGLYFIDQATYATAILMGYSSESAAGLLRARAGAVK